jgi:diguanylate cyclase (GGDEF)-like protein
MAYRDQVMARFGLRVVAPAVAVLIGALVIVIISLSEMANQVDLIEDRLTQRSAQAAINVAIRRLTETHRDYAQWDDAVRNLYGEPDPVFIAENFISSTSEPVFFDTAMLVDEVGLVRAAYRHGEPIVGTPTDLFGPVIATMIRQLVRDGTTYDVRGGIVASKWGLTVVAAGTIVPFSEDFAPRYERSRVLILAKAFDADMVDRLAEDFSIPGFRLVEGLGVAHSLPIVDPAGQTIGAVAWMPPSLGTEAHSRVSPTVFMMLALVGLTMAFLIAIALRGAREIERRDAEARHAALHDDLTGLANRTALVRALDSAAAARRADGTPVAVVYLDLDGFKEVNDAFGHEAGDRLLQEVARGFESRCEGHLLARIGGDEFAIVVSGPGAVKVACDLGWRLIGFVSEPFEIDGRVMSVGTSVGVAVADAMDGSAEELLRRADVAMYQAKQQGPNRLFVYDAVIDTIRHERLEIADDLRRALKDDRLHLAYQPVLSAETRRIVAVEALLRWDRPGYGPLPPSVFVPIAEQSGLIDDLGRWTLRRACTDATAWPGIKVSVNVSPAQFRNPNFEYVVADVLKQAGLPASRLEIEVTESYFIVNPDQARKTIDAIRALGVTVALDDFGTGYSSIGYLRSFTFEKLKLDRSLIAGIAEDERVRRLVTSTIALAEALGLRVTAEGVETEDEAMLLKQAGCSEFQGFFFARPSSPETVSALLKNPSASPWLAASA